MIKCASVPYMVLLEGWLVGLCTSVLQYMLMGYCGLREIRTLACPVHSLRANAMLSEGARCTIVVFMYRAKDLR